MQKLLALATGLAACGAVSAQSSVVLYGSLDQAAVRITDIGGRAANRLDPGTTQPDRFGFRITEDLGDGLKANAQLEAGYATDTGASANASAFFNRVSVVGLSGGFGSVLLGHQPDLMFDWVGKTSNGFLLANFYAFHPGNFDTLANTFQFDNAIRYTSPTFFGFQVAGIAGASEGTGRNTSVGFNYLGGGLRIAGAYSVEKNRVLRGFAPFATAAGLPASGVTDQVKNAGIGASVKLAAFNLNTNYTQTAIEAVGRSATLRNVDLGVSYAATPAATVNLGYTRSELNDAHWNTFSLMNLYALSKRTQVYAQGTLQRASAGQAALLFGAGTSSNERQALVGVGVHHSF